MKSAAASFSVPDLVEPIRAWRVWRAVHADGTYSLGSVVHPTLWPAGEPLVADCLGPQPLFPWFNRRRERPPAPEPRCACGIYAAALDEIGRYMTRIPTCREAGRVVGEVALWGTVIECERGFRASHAYPLRLFVPTDEADRSRRSDALPREIAIELGRYGVPVDVLPVGRKDAIEAVGRLAASPDRALREA